MNISHVSSSPRRTPSPAWRLFLSRFQTTSLIPRDLSRLSAGLLLGVACLTSQASAALIFGEPTNSPTLGGGFERGTADWGKDSSGNDTGPWHQTPANAFESTTSREGTRSVRFLPRAGGNRSEFVINGGFGVYDWGTDYWLGFSVRVIQPNQGFGRIVQMHSTPRTVGGVTDWDISSGENSFTLDAKNGNFIVHTATNAANVNGEDKTVGGVTYHHTQSGSSSWGTVAVSRPYVLNRWFDFVLHFKLATNNTGIMEVWMKDTVTGVTEKLVNVLAGVTVYAYDSGYNHTTKTVGDGQPKTAWNNQKIGLYYGTGSEAIGGEVLYDAFRIWEGSGGSYNAVAPGGGGSAPNAPTSLTASAPTSSSINLGWNASAVTNETGFEIDRATNSAFTTGPSPITNAYTAGVNATGITATGLSPSTLYYFRVRATNGLDSANSNTASSTTASGAFQMSSNQVVMEAENATSRTASVSPVHTWNNVTESGASGAGSNNAIQSLPNTTDVSVATPSTAACRADYQITVPAGSAASFYVHVRGRGADGADNSINVSIDGSTATYQTISNLPTGTALGAWVASSGTLAIPSGTHTVTVWMRENGAIIDKLVVKNNTTLPTGTGPAESPH